LPIAQRNEETPSVGLLKQALIKAVSHPYVIRRALRLPWLRLARRAIPHVGKPARDSTATAPGRVGFDSLERRLDVASVGKRATTEHDQIPDRAGRRYAPARIPDMTPTISETGSLGEPAQG
jgi:hypothetical protein